MGKNSLIRSHNVGHKLDEWLGAVSGLQFPSISLSVSWEWPFLTVPPPEWTAEQELKRCLGAGFATCCLLQGQALGLPRTTWVQKKVPSSVPLQDYGRWLGKQRQLPRMASTWGEEG